MFIQSDIQDWNVHRRPSKNRVLALENTQFMNVFVQRVKFLYSTVYSFCLFLSISLVWKGVKNDFRSSLMDITPSFWSKKSNFERKYLRTRLFSISKWTFSFIWSIWNPCFWVFFKWFFDPYGEHFHFQQNITFLLSLWALEPVGFA